MTVRHGSPRIRRRRFLQGAAATLLAPALHVRAAESFPDIPALSSFLAGRVPRRERVHLTLPRLADNGFAVPLKLVVDGPFSPSSYVRSLRLFSETNPVPDMAVFEFSAPIDRVELDSRIRLAGTQRIVAVASLSDGTLLATAEEVIVTLAGCMDGT